jgi:hypothetical protein
MYPEDRVLVGVMPHPADLEIAQNRHWYRVPVSHAPNGIFAEYIAFYMTGKFPEALRYQIRYYARRTGHELVRRRDLMPDQPGHPRADNQYYKIQLGPVKTKEPPIISRRWRRITFIQTTWDRFVSAEEINDLFRAEDVFVDRVYHALKMRGIQPEREQTVREGGKPYQVDMVIPCKNGPVVISSREDRPHEAHVLTGNTEEDIEHISKAIQGRGGPLMIDIPI